MKSAYRMEKGVSCHLWTAAAHVVDVVSFQGNHVIRSSQIDTPIVIAIASGRIRSHTIKVRVRDSYSVVGAGPKNQMLTADARGLCNRS
jgi:hypothetical protein